MAEELSFLLAVSDGSEMVAVTRFAATSEEQFLQMINRKAARHGLRYFFRRKTYECTLCEWMEQLEQTKSKGWMLDDGYLFCASPLSGGGICWEERGVVPGAELV